MITYYDLMEMLEKWFPAIILMVAFAIFIFFMSRKQRRDMTKMADETLRSNAIRERAAAALERIANALEKKS